MNTMLAVADSPGFCPIAALSRHCAAAYAKLGQGLDLDALEQAATAIGTGSRRREDVSKKRDAEDADGEGPSKVGLRPWARLFRVM
jgi:hypothetical protein